MSDTGRVAAVDVGADRDGTAAPSGEPRGGCCGPSCPTCEALKNTTGYWRDMAGWYYRMWREAIKEVQLRTTPSTFPKSLYYHFGLNEDGTLREDRNVFPSD